MEKHPYRDSNGNIYIRVDDNGETEYESVIPKYGVIAIFEESPMEYPVKDITWDEVYDYVHGAKWRK